LQALVSDVAVPEVDSKYQIKYLEAFSKTGERPNARVTLLVDGVEETVAADGDGPVDAAFNAIEKIAHSDAQLSLYSVNAITSGSDSQGEVTVRLERSGAIVNGSGADTDIVVASVKAYLEALNLLAAGVIKAHPQKEGV